ncbi:MAG TPA: hypothetical protein VNA25_01430 [Phycisphaerae bacterium]|nr:hypothetical protein [Phycisphaerae bacterium]
MTRNAKVRCLCVSTGVLVVAVLLVAAGRGSAQQPKGLPVHRPEQAIETRLYDVQDLIQPRPDHPLPPGLTPPSGLLVPSELYYDDTSSRYRFEAPKPVMDPDFTAAVLADLIQRSIEPGSWASEGGAGTLQIAGAMLVIRNAPQAHEMVGQLLAEMRKARRQERTIVVSARWVLLDPQEVNRILAAGAGGGPVALSQDMVAKAETPYCGQVVAFEGRTAHVLSGRGQTVMLEAEPVVSDFALSWDVTHKTAFWGAMLEARAVLDEEVKAAIVDVYSEVGEPTKAPAKTRFVYSKSLIGVGISAGMETLDRLEFTTNTLRTSARIPMDKPVIVGGMGAARQNAKHMYLVLTVSAAK